MAKGNRTTKAVLFLLFFPALLFSARTSEYYRNRLRYSPHFIYYQRQYILTLLSEKKASTADRWLKKYRKTERERGRSLLLRGIMLAATGRLSQARTIWKKWWPFGNRRHYYLEREYRKYKLSSDLLGFYTYLSSRYPTHRTYFKRVCIYSIYGGDPKRFSRNISQLMKKSLSSPVYLARALYPHLFGIHRKTKFLAALNRDSTFGVYCNLLLRNGEAERASRQLQAGLKSGKLRMQTGLSLLKRFRNLKNSKPYFRILRILPETRLGDRDRIRLAQFLERSNPGRAERIYRSLPEKPAALRGMSRIFTRSGKFSQALVYQKKIRSPLKKDWRIRGILHSLKGDLNGALMAFNLLFVEERALYSALALLAGGKDRKEIISVLFQGLRNPAGDGKALPALRLLYHLRYIPLTKSDRKKATEAIRYYWTGRLLSAAGQLAEIGAGKTGENANLFYFAAGRLATKERKYNQAALWLNKAASGKSGIRDRALFRLAKIYKYRLNQKLAARELFLHIIAKYPTSLYLYESRKELKQ